MNSFNKIIIFLLMLFLSSVSLINVSFAQTEYVEFVAGTANGVWDIWGQYVSQGITTGNSNFIISQIDFQLTRLTGATGTIQVDLYTSNAGKTGTLIGNLGSIDISTLVEILSGNVIGAGTNTSNVWVSLSTNSYTLNANTQYVLLLNDGNINQDWLAYTSYVTPLYNGGDNFYGASIPPTLYNQQDMYFRIWGNPTSSTPTIEYNVSNFYISSDISFDLNTTTNTNMSYSLDSNSEISICINCNQTTLNLNSLNDSLHNIILISSDFTGQVNSSVNFTIDTILPTINNNILGEYNLYNNINLNSSCSDLNLDYCNISINNQNFDISNLFNSTLNGNLSYNITAQDLAGHQINQTGSIFINPFQYFYFKYFNGTNINDYSFGGKLFNNYSYFKLYNDIFSIGNNSLIFEKLGLITSNFSISIQNNSRINQTYNISQSKIILKFLNKDTSQIIPGENFSLDFIGDVGFNSWTNTGFKNVSNLFFNNQNYQLIVRNNNYKTENIFFQFNNKQNLLIDVYLINKTSSNLGNVYIYSVDNFGAPLKSVIVQALQWDSSKSSYIKVSEIKTDDTGLGNLNIILDSKLYAFRAIYNNQIIDSVPQTIATNDNGKTIVLTLPTNIITNDYLFKDVIFNVSENFNNVSNISTIFFNWNNNAGNKINGCIAIYRLFVVNGDKKLIERDCSLNSASANMIKAFFINSSNDILLSAEVNDSNKYITIKTFIHYSNFQINKLLSDLDLSKYILPLLFILSIVIGIKLNVAMGGFGVIVSGGIGLFLVPQFINKSIVAFIIFIGIALIVGGNKRK